jgi:hypothetical protein
MVSKMSLALELLRDGEWHSLEEMQELVELDEFQAEEFASFLDEYDFATRDSTRSRVRLTRRFLDLLCETVIV